MAESAQGDLWQRMSLVADKATKSKHLVTIGCEFESVYNEGINFVIRHAPQLSTKTVATLSPKNNTPFFPPEPELFVESVGDDHNLILNKYNVLPLHGLITTKQFVSQTDQLSWQDFHALSLILNQVDGFIFYNGDRRAGASQPHRHFQLVPKNLGNGQLPVEVAISQLHSHDALFPFQHRLFYLPNTEADTLFDAWQKMEYSWQPYNLLLTRQWMLVVPRLCESAGSISINSLGFAGALLAKSDIERDFILQHGPMAILSSVCPK
jgi:ATP adenylyltransferase